MLYNVVPVLLIFAALTIIVIIVLRRLPEITVINTDTIPTVRAAAVKRQLLAQSLERKLRHLMTVMWGIMVASGAKVQETGVALYKKLIALEERYRTMSSVRPKIEHPAESLSLNPVGQLLIDAIREREAGRLEEAERIYLEAIRLDHRNADAYLGLGAIYRSRHQYEEAIEALRFSRRLRDNASSAAALGEVCLEAGKTSVALAALKDAVRYEPANQHYLDRLTEAAILVGNKRVAIGTLAKLTELNAAYPKLVELKQRIAAIPARSRRVLDH